MVRITTRNQKYFERLITMNDEYSEINANMEISLATLIDFITLEDEVDEGEFGLVED